MKVFLDTVGCRLNQSEIDTYARQFQAAGHTLVNRPGEADLVVVNTCAVTAAAASDSRQKVRQAARQGAGEIIVTGCWSSLNSEAALALPQVSTVVPNLQKDQLAIQVLQARQEEFDLEPVLRVTQTGARLKTRAFIKVQDGCDNRCTFCVTTLARGESRSRPIPEILADIQASLQGDEGAGTAAKEIVLTGVHLGSWGQDLSAPLHLRQLVELILGETDVPRLRLSSLEPWDLDEAFFGLWENPRLCRHLHLPLQSGCAATLRRMARKTTPETFRRLVQAARQVSPNIAITTDVITGFPGETAKEFEQSLAFVEEMEFAGGHGFSYSPRPGTAAARMPHQIPLELRKERNHRLRQVFSACGQAYQQRFLGQSLDVLWESASLLGPENWEMSGLTDNYIRVSAIAPRHLWNQITPVLLQQITEAGLSGSMAAGQ